MLCCDWLRLKGAPLTTQNIAPVPSFLYNFRKNGKKRRHAFRATLYRNIPHELWRKVFPANAVISDWTENWTGNWGNLALESTALPAGTESRHEFLVHGDLLRWSSLRTSRKDITWSNSSLFCNRRWHKLCNRTTLQMHLLIYHPNKLSVYNMLMQLLSTQYERF